MGRNLLPAAGVQAAAQAAGHMVKQCVRTATRGVISRGDPAAAGPAATQCDAGATRRYGM